MKREDLNTMVAEMKEKIAVAKEPTAEQIAQIEQDYRDKLAQEVSENEARGFSGISESSKAASR